MKKKKILKKYPSRIPIYLKTKDVYDNSGPYADGCFRSLLQWKLSNPTPHGNK